MASQIESDDDFLARTNAPASHKGDEDDDAFLARTGGSVANSKAPDIPTIVVRPGAQTDAPQSQAPSNGPDISARVHDLLAPAPNTTYGDVLPIARDETTGALRPALPNMIRAPLIGLTQEGGQATINPETNTLGVTPEAQSVAAFAANPLRFGAPAFVPPGTLDARAPLSPEFVANPMAPGLADRVPGNALSSGPVSATGIAEPAPMAAGASATPTQQSNMTMREQLVNRAQAEQEKLNELQPRGPDLNRYVPGVDPTMAQMEQSVKTSREQKNLSTISPEISDQARGVEKNHIEARKAFFVDKIAGSKPEVDALDMARKQQAAADTAAAFKPGQVTDATPAVNTISNILTAPRAQENTALQKYVAPILARLYKSDGTLKSDPEQLYGLREDLERMRSKPSQAEDKNLIHVSGQLKDIRDVLDQVIEAGAPGYRTYMNNYANASQRINELETLQGHENGLNGFKTYTPFQSMMRKIVEARQAPGNNPYKSISDDTMSKLWALRDDLRRGASAEDLAKARGSDTLQNVFDMAKTVGKLGVRAGLHYGLYQMTGDLGANSVLGLADYLNSQRAQTRTVRRAREMLNPNPLRYPPPNAGPDPNSLQSGNTGR